LLLRTNETHLLLAATSIRISRYICREIKTQQEMTDTHLQNNNHLTPKKLLNSNKNCFICSVAVNSKQRIHVFKSGSKGTSSVDLQGLINKTLGIDVTVYSNSDVAVCIKCYKSLVKYRKADKD